MARLKGSLGSVPSILAALDAWHLNLLASAAIGPRVKRPLRRLEARRARRFEARALGWYERVVMVTAEDAAAVRELNPSLPLEVIRNGVDTSRFTPAAVPSAEPGHIVFTGALAYPPNVAAAQHLALRILPRVRRAVPDAHLTIVGRSPCRTVRALASPGVVDVVADVPEVQPWLQRAEVYACPMISGTGIKNKLLEALACGSPAVATALSCQGMSVRSEEQLLIANGEERFAEAIVRLMRDPALRARLAAAARRYVLQDHSWPAVARSYERIYSEVIAAATR
jgi:glycosyltransferase involved in cell wall biosynthesis